MSPHVSEESDNNSPEWGKYSLGDFLWAIFQILLWIPFIAIAISWAVSSWMYEYPFSFLYFLLAVAIQFLVYKAIGYLVDWEEPKRREKMERKNREHAARLQNQLESQMREMLNGRPLPPEIESKMEQLLSDMQSNLENMDSK